MTATIPPPVRFAPCGRGLHELDPDTIVCPACEAADSGDRGERIRARMTQLIVGFAYVPPRGWEHRAACRDADGELFDLAEQGNGLTRDQVTRISVERHQEARNYCEVCPVVAECLGDALMRQARGTRGGELFTDADWTFTPTKKLLKELGL